MAGAHVKLPTHLPASPSKSKPASVYINSHKPVLPSQFHTLSVSDVPSSVPRPAESSVGRSLQFSTLASPPRTPLSNITNSTNLLHRLQFPHIPLCASVRAQLATCSDSNIDSTSSTPGSSSFATPLQSPHPTNLSSLLSPANPASQLPRTSAGPPTSDADMVVTPLPSATATLPLPSPKFTPATPEIAEPTIAQRQAHIIDDASSSDADSEDLASTQETTRVGEIHLFVGPMFAGKSTSLLNSVRHHIALGRSIATIKSHKDDRYANNFVVTHNGDREACYAVPTLRAFKEQVPEAYRECDVIAIDEGQFFSDLFEFCLHAADKDGKIIFIAGLDGDFQRRKFGAVLDLIPYADSITKLHSNCAFCSRKGLFSLRISADTRQEVVGGADQYRPVCRHHYLQLSSTRVAHESTKE